MAPRLHHPHRVRPQPRQFQTARAPGSGRQWRVAPAFPCRRRGPARSNPWGVGSLLEFAFFLSRLDAVLGDPVVPYFRLSESSERSSRTLVREALQKTPLPKGADSFSSFAHCLGSKGGGCI